jgi:MFS transporter, FSR family, fosmidomycin resistance protein
MSANAHALTRGERSTVFALVGAGHFMSHVYILSLPPLFALIKTELEISYAALGLLVTAFHVATGFSQVPAGFAVDRFGARKTLLFGMFLSAVCMGSVGLVETYPLMIALTVMAGVGNSVFHPADYAILAGTVQKQHLGKAFGFHLLAGNLGFATAPVLMVALAAWFDWRMAMVVVGGAGVAIGLCMLLFGHNLRAAVAPQVDTSADPCDDSAQSLLSPALLTMLGFFVLIALATAGIQTFSVTVLNKVYGVSLESANTALTVFLGAGFVGVATGGFVADRLREPVVVVNLSMLTCAVALALVSVVALPFALLLLMMAIGGAAVGLMRPARDMMVNAIAPPGTTGKAFGFMGTGLSTGGAVAPVVFGWMIDIGAAHYVLGICAALTLAAVGTATAVHRLGRLKREAAPEPAE